MKSDFKFTSEKIEQLGKPPATVFHLHGWLDVQSEKLLLSAVEEARATGTSTIILNLEELTMLTSMGIRAIQKAQKMFESDSAIKLCNAPPNVYHVLKLSGFLQFMPVYESLEAALSS
ncbi:MAG TPA: STAS domain-containing protein [Anaerolineales bacterium]|nr:STAS domain-containing protein [Anaerolineales bacterium]